jgi:hypothetical protein
MKSKLFVSAVMILCSSLILSAAQTPPQVKKFSHPELSSLEAMKPNGEYVISVWKDGRWQEAGRLAYDRFLREREIDLSPYLAGTDAPKIKITEQGPGAAHIDSVLLGGRPPEAAQGRDAGRILKKLSTKDNDVINAQGESFELAFSGRTADKTLRLAARIESTKIGTTPFQFPTANLFTKIGPHSKFYSYALNASAPPQGKVGSDEYLKTVGQRPPFFEVYARTGSGHPAGTTYGWVSNDEKNLYVTLDFTPDNTFDGDKDYAQVYVHAGRSVKEFKASVPEKKWGVSHFTYTDKVNYEHKVYDFVIPLSELGTSPEDREIRLAFAAYGTATAVENQYFSLAFDPDHKRYLLVYEDYEDGDFGLYGKVIDINGDSIEIAGNDWVIISNAVSSQYFPDVAYDSASGRFLVVWQDDRDGPMCSDIYGQMVNSDGSLYGDNFIIATDYLCQYRPAVANDSNQHQFLVVWYQHYLAETGFDILGQLVDGNGNLIPPASSTARIQSTANGGTNFVISNALGDQAQPDVAFDSQANAYLVVFSDEPSEPALRIQGLDAFLNYSTIKGQFISWNGVPLFNDTDVNFLVSDPAYEAVNPAIANDSVNHRFLAAWADYPIEVNSSPTPQGTARTSISLDNRWTHRTQPPQPDHGTLVSHSTTESDGIPRTPGTVRPQALQVDGDEQPFIYGQLIDTAGNLVYESRFLVSDESEDLPDWLYLNQNNPAVAFDSANQTYLAIHYVFWWDDEYGDGGLEFGGRYLSAAGEVISDWVGVYGWDTDEEEPWRSPALAYNSYCRNFLAAWPCYCGNVHWEIIGSEECVNLPEVTTAAITNITPTSASSGGNVTSDGGAAVTVRGVCWNTTGSPTTGDSHTSNGSGLGAFISQMTGLSPNTKYFVRAYATNSVGTGYGNELTFTTLKQFKVTFVAGSGGTVSGTLVQYVSEGGNCTPVEARADTGFCFINWTGTTGFAGSSANPLTVTNVRQDMTITANFGKLALVVQKLTEKAWIVKQYYGKIVLSVDGLDPTVPIKYVLNRKQSGGEYKALKEFNSSELQNNTYTYEDKFLEADVTYIYQVVAYNPSGQVIGRSDEITVR